MSRSATASLEEWIQKISGSGWVWYSKRLSGNDTQSNKTHQAGPYIAKNIVFDLFPSLQARREHNPRISLASECFYGGGIYRRQVNVIWYNNKVTGSGTRDECRITNWGGASSPLLNPESTGSLSVFAFHRAKADSDVDRALIWVCAGAGEEDLLENYVGKVDPGYWSYRSGETGEEIALPGLVPESERSNPCAMNPDEIEKLWGGSFPSGRDIVRKVVSLAPQSRKTKPDARILSRRDCEFVLFKSLEKHFVLREINDGFDSVDRFVSCANSVLNRRKARSGRSLELQFRQILEEEGIGNYSYEGRSEGNRRPDFIFPSEAAYQDCEFPSERLRMLAVKTTCKDRWRQILREADRITTKHLLTLQEGVSVAQFQEMSEAGVRLVVPADLHCFYPREIRGELMQLSEFIEEIRAVCN